LERVSGERVGDVDDGEEEMDWVWEFRRVGIVIREREAMLPESQAAPPKPMTCAMRIEVQVVAILIDCDFSNVLY